MMREFEGGGEEHGRCLELLKWINARCRFADEEIVQIFRADELRARRPLSPRTRA
jgi:hypothetical protein